MKRLFIKSGLVIAVALLVGLNSCGDSESSENDFDCSCEEVVKSNGKFYQSGLHKEDDHVDIDKIFTGTCATKDDKGNIIKKSQFENGYIIESQEWKSVNGELYQILDMKFDDNKSENGYRMKVESHHGFVYPMEYTRYESGKDVAHYYMQNAYGKTVMSGDLGQGFFELSCLLEGYDNDKYEMLDFLQCIEKEHLPNFFFVNGDNVKKESSQKVSKEQPNKKPELTENIVEESNQEEIDATITYFSINDPDGYSNLREEPNGTIIRKVLDTEVFQVIGEKDNHKEVLFDDGSTGFIHESRVIEL